MRMWKKYAAGGLLVSAIPGFAVAAAPQGTATAEGTTHVKRLVLDEIHTSILSKHDFAGAEVATSRTSGKVVGVDDFTGHIRHGHVRYQSAFAFQGGLLLVRLHPVGDTKKYVGRVIGGTGAYEGATGTVTGRNLGHGNTAETLRYQL